ncbi:hypothetical protein A2W24_05270 [Microgenomates group bacterium RBG_16_45_19]|nr:MAG: hypothetical protein A2W24_05270 [Microgenomates group bacterium RBG_16_45_19]
MALAENNPFIRRYSISDYAGILGVIPITGESDEGLIVIQAPNLLWAIDLLIRNYNDYILRNNRMEELLKVENRQAVRDLRGRVIDLSYGAVTQSG